MVEGKLSGVISIAPGDRLHRLGRYTFNPKLPGLVAETEVIRLRPKVAAALPVLLDQRVVSRDELARAIWGPSSAEHLRGNALDQIIADLRRVLRAIPKVTLRHEAKGAYQLITTPEPEPSVAPSATRVFPLKDLLDHQLVNLGGIAPQTEVFIAAPQPLEVQVDYAGAAMAHLDGRAKITYLLNEQHARAIPKVLFNLLLHDYLNATPHLLNDNQRARIAERLQVLKRSLRITLAPQAATAVHLQVYRADDRRAAIAILIPPNSDEYIVYAEGKDAFDLANDLRAIAPHRPTPGIIMTAGVPLSQAIITDLSAGLHDYFEPYGIYDEIRSACGLPKAHP